MKPTRRRLPLSLTFISLIITCFLRPSSPASLSFVYEDLYARPYYQVSLLGDHFLNESDILPLLKDKRKKQQCLAEGKHNLLEGPWTEKTQQKPRFLSPDYVLMKTESAGRFLCTVPRPVPEESSMTEAEYLLSEKERLRKGLERGTELLAPMKCIYYINGWFTYEYCHGRHIRQYHRPASKTGAHNPADRPPLFEYYLGRDMRNQGFGLGLPKESSRLPPVLRHNHEQTDKGNEVGKTRTDDEEELAQVGLEDGTIYITFRYKDGTVCDITGKPRTAKVHFFCNPQHSEHISQVQEPSICDYVISIQTPRLCNDPAFVPRSTNPIKCHPII